MLKNQSTFLSVFYMRIP